jgi:LmbE family N-acetylglucosaminyl deacetylase
LTTAREVLAEIRTLPHGDLAKILNGGTPVVLAPHPDDEVIGCGELLTAAVLAGIEPAILFITDGSGSHPKSRAFPRHALMALRQQEACAAASILGVDLAHVHFLGIRDTAAPHDGPELIAAVNRILAVIAGYPNPVIFAPWIHDPHGDHQAVCKMAHCAAQALEARHLSYLVWGWTLPDDQVLGRVKVAGWRFRETDAKSQKLRALGAYKSQISDLIDDDPTGFRLDGVTLTAMISEDEVFLINP